MKVTLEQIDELRSRVNVTYEEAKSTLERNDGDLIKSIIELEKKKGTKGQHKTPDGFTNFVNRLLELKLSVKDKSGNTLINLPFILMLGVFILAFWVVLIGLVLAICTSCKVKIYRDKNSSDIDDIKRNVQETVEKLKVKTESIIREDKEQSEFVNNEDNDPNEIIIS